MHSSPRKIREIREKFYKVMHGERRSTIFAQKQHR
jgi:hypothetical protein